MRVHAANHNFATGARVAANFHQESEREGARAQTFDANGDVQQVVVDERAEEFGFDADAGILHAQGFQVGIRNVGGTQEFRLGRFEIPENGRIVNAAAGIGIGETQPALVDEWHPFYRKTWQ